jgi:hypothetical protein
VLLSLNKSHRQRTTKIYLITKSPTKTSGSAKVVMKKLQHLPEVILYTFLRSSKCIASGR